jgi:predicted  nucleic acid-binding Zn-ribbon protein
MHPQLEILLELQDLQSQRRALQEDPAKEVEEQFFELKPAQALDLLEEKIDELAARLEPQVQRRFHDISDSLDRAVVPVLNGICYGCFVAIPTAWSSEASRNDRITVCDHCGRFLYYVD